jgi:hypothetical protein
MAQWVPMGQGNVDLPAIVGVLRQHAPNIAFNLEIITCREPRLIPYADQASDFWNMYPHMLARDFARFVSLATRGTPEPLDQLTIAPDANLPPPGAAGEGLRAQQRQHFEASVRYTQEALGLGASHAAR